MAHIFEDATLLKKLLFLGSSQQPELCLEFHKIRFDPIQVPVLYHAKLLKLLAVVLAALGNKAAKLRKLLKSFLPPDYLFSLLALDDIFSHQGVPAEMKFVLKVSALQLAHVYVDYAEVESEVLQQDGLSGFLQKCRRTWLVGGERREVIWDNEMVYLPYLKEYRAVLDLYGRHSGLFFREFIKPLLEKLREVMEKHMTQEREYNYEMLVDLLELPQADQGEP